MKPLQLFYCFVILLNGLAPSFCLAVWETKQPKVLDETSHNSSWFTQGLYWDNGTLFISSGLYGRSQLIVENKTQQLKTVAIPQQYFAEGLTVIDDKLYLLTWKEQTLFVIDKYTLALHEIWHYKGEGWGLTHTDNHFIMSNGSNRLMFRNLNTFAIESELHIESLDKLNELEYVDGIVWANRWLDDGIYAIDIHQGCIKQRIDLSKLRQQATFNEKSNNKKIDKHSKKSAAENESPVKQRDQVTNGIAYDVQRNALWVTGKFWSKRYLIELPKLSSSPCLASDQTSQND